MKKRITTTLIIIVATSIITVMATMIANDWIESNDTYIDYKMGSTILGETRKLIVKLPNGYSKEEAARYPVVYIIGSSGLMSRISNDVDLLNRTGHLEKMILVCVTHENAKNRRRDLTPPFLLQELDKKNAPLGKADKFLSYIEKEVIPFVDNEFKTNSQDLILGHSREGLFTMYSLLARPELFDGYIALSPALWREENLFIDKMNASLSTIVNADSFLYMSMGDTEVEKMTNAFNITIDLLSLNNGKIEWISQYTPDATHQTNHYLSATIGIVKYFERNR